MANMSRKEREKERIRQEILDAAAEEFSRSGYRDTSMNAIASRVELSVGTLYNFFPSKDALFITLLDTKATEFFLDEQEETEKLRDPLEKIRFLMSYHFSRLLENLPLFRLFIDVKYEKNMPAIEKEHPLITVKVENHLRFVAGIFKEAVEAGVIRQAPPMLLAISLDSLTFGILEKWDYQKDQVSAEELIAELESLFLDGILVR